MTVSIHNVLPPDEFEGASLTQPISFSLGSDSSVMLATVQIQVRGERVYDGALAAFDSGWTSSAQQVNATLNGYNFRLVPDATKQWQRGETIEVYAVASDASGVEEFWWSFTVEGEALSLSLYPMILKSVRDRDGGTDGLLSKLIALPGGLDDIWRTRMFEPASDVLDSYNPQKIAARWLPWLKAMVGLGRDLSFNPTETQLRAIIALFPVLMKHKPSDLSLDYAIRMVTGNRFWIRDFFDLRMVEDDVYITEMLRTQDPNLLDFPSDTPSGTSLTWCTGSSSYPCTHEFFIADLPEYHFPGRKFGSDDRWGWLEIVEWPADPDFVGFYRIASTDAGTTKGTLLESGPAGPNMAGTGKWRLWGENSEFITEVRLVDDPDGSIAVDRTLLEFFIHLIRPLSERIEITWIDFLDTFPVIKDLEQWEMDGTTPYMPEVGAMAIPPVDGSARINFGPALLWGERSLAVRCKAIGADAILQIRFLVADADNYYYVEIHWTAQRVRLYKVVSTAATQVGSDVTLTDLLPGYEDVFRCNVIKSGGGADHRLQVIYDGTTIIDEVVSPAPFLVGGVELVSGGGSEEVWITFVEVIALPATTTRIGPNP